MLVDTFECLGVPLEPSKLEGPDTSLSFLEIEVDTIKLQICLPSDKLSRLKEKLADTVTQKYMSKQNLQSLTSLLQHATKVVHPGRPFLHRLDTLQQVGTLLSHQFRLNLAAWADLLWWHLFMKNGMGWLWHGI